MTRRRCLAILLVLAAATAPAASPREESESANAAARALGGGAPSATNKSGLHPQALQITATARSIQPGELVVLHVTAGSVERLRARVFGREFSGFQDTPATWTILVGIDLDVAPGRYVAQIDAGASNAALGTYPLVVKPRTFATRTLKVDEGFVNPPANMQERIAREAAALDRLWKSPTPARLWTGPFVRPVPDAANSAFGSRSIFNGQRRSPHGGADFLSPSGRVVVAPNGGRVVLAGDLYYTGGTVVIDHGLGLLSLFAHLSAIDVHEADLVEGGSRIGLVGSTGRVTGPHLHWAVRAGGARIDPLSLLSALGPPAAKAMH